MRWVAGGGNRRVCRCTAGASVLVARGRPPGAADAAAARENPSYSGPGLDQAARAEVPEHFAAAPGAGRGEALEALAALAQVGLGAGQLSPQLRGVAAGRVQRGAQLDRVGPGGVDLAAGAVERLAQLTLVGPGALQRRAQIVQLGVGLRRALAHQHRVAARLPARRERGPHFVRRHVRLVSLIPLAHGRGLRPAAPASSRVSGRTSAAASASSPNAACGVCSAACTSTATTIPPALPASHTSAAALPLAAPARRSVASRITGRLASSTNPIGTTTTQAAPGASAGTTQPPPPAGPAMRRNANVAPRRATTGGSTAEPAT